jgi:hypothetical protein
LAKGTIDVDVLHPAIPLCIVPVRVIDNQVHLDLSFISISGSITTIFLAKS